MTDTDRDAFDDVFLKLRRLFRLLGEAHDIAQVSAAYFKVLKRWPLSAVTAGAEKWIETGKRFPKPAEWIESIPKHRPTSTIPALSADEAIAYVRAERLHYEDEPCTCADCRAAGVTHRFVRFVPEADEHDRDIYAMIGERRVTRGHWAHGDELRRWYAARDAFWDTCRSLGLMTKQTQRATEKLPFEERILKIFEKRPTP